MQHYTFKEKGESVKVFAWTKYQTNELKVFKIKDSVLEDITPDPLPAIVSSYEDIKHTTLVMPNEDCTVCVVLNREVSVIRVGIPSIRFIYYTGVPLVDIPYVRVNEVSSDILQEGVLEDLGHGFYTMMPNDVGNSIIKVHNRVYPVRVPYLANATGVRGKIHLEKNAWTLLALPKLGGTIYNDFVKPIEEQTSMAGSEIFEILNAYPYIDNQNKEMLSFKPGTTNSMSKHNFKLVYLDGEYREITGFWCRTKDYPGDEITFEWSSIQ